MRNKKRDQDYRISMSFLVGQNDDDSDGGSDISLEISLCRSSAGYLTDNAVVRQPLVLPPPSSLRQQQQSDLPLQLLFPQTDPELHLQQFPSQNSLLPADPNPNVTENLNSSSRPTNGSRRNGSSRPARGRLNSARNRPRRFIVPPFPWATNHPANVHSLHYLQSIQIFSIAGEVECQRCERKYEIEYDLTTKFYDVASFLVENRYVLHDRAPAMWMDPATPTCKFCNQKSSAKPIIAEKKKGINWLFLLLGQMLGICTIDQLKYFCKYTGHHRTGAKDRLLYTAYVTLCKQLDPNGPFSR